MELRITLSGFGFVQEKDGAVFVYIIAISPRASSNFWRVYRRYSHFKFVAQKLLDKVGLHLIVSTANVVFTCHGPFDDETDVQFPLQGFTLPPLPRPKADIVSR